jgi:polysaccharide biosynthesis transport protein
MNHLASPTANGLLEPETSSRTIIFGGQAAPRESGVAQYLRIARRWKWVIIGAIAVGIAIALIATLLMTPMYSATTTMEIAREEARIVNVQGVQPQSSSVDQEFYQTQYGLLSSYSVAERVARQLNLAENRDFLQTFGVSDGEGLISDERPLDNSAAARARRLRDATEVLLDHVAVSPARMSRLVDLTFASPNPQLSVRIANTWTQVFIQTNIERRFEATAYARTFLEQRLAELRQRLDQSERQLVAYAANQQIININVPTENGVSGERPIATDELVAFNSSLAMARAQRIAAESAYREAISAGGATITGLNNAALNGMRQQRAEIAANHSRLTAQFGTEYPQVVSLAAQLREIDRSIATEERRVVAALRNEFDQARQREQALSNRVESLKGDLLDLRRRSIQYNILQREVDTNRSLYDGLLQRYKEIGIAGGVGTNNISIVDQAEVPERPSSPRPLLNLMLGLLIGSVAGAGMALALDQIDEAITDPNDMEKVLGVPSLGVVPRMKTDDPMAELQDRRSALTEAYLTIRTNLQFATPHGVPRTLLVTSTRAAEGKSTTSIALALMLSRQAKRVVIIDADMRSPSLHNELGISNEKGLSNVLSGNAAWHEVVRDSSLETVKAIAAGPHPPNAADLLSGPRLEALLADLLKNFDHVVVDSPPLLGLADAPLIASRVEGVVYVVESYGVQSRSAKLAINRLLNSGATVLGAILTKFVSKKAAYGYGYDYGYGYGQEET